VAYRDDPCVRVVAFTKPRSRGSAGRTQDQDSRRHERVERRVRVIPERAGAPEPADLQPWQPEILRAGIAMIPSASHDKRVVGDR
jgi:hypothetical protein